MDIYLQDRVIDLDDITLVKDDSVFSLISQPTRTYEKDYNVQMEILVSLNLDQHMLAR